MDSKTDVLNKLAVRIRDQLREHYVNFQEFAVLEAQVKYLIKEVVAIKDERKIDPVICQKIWLALQGGPATIQEICTATGFNIQSVSDGLKKLQEAGVVSGSYDLTTFGDGRSLFKYKRI